MSVIKSLVAVVAAVVLTATTLSLSSTASAIPGGPCGLGFVHVGSENKPHVSVYFAYRGGQFCGIAYRKGTWRSSAGYTRINLYRDDGSVLAQRTRKVSSAGVGPIYATHYGCAYAIARVWPAGKSTRDRHESAFAWEVCNRRG